MEQNKMIDMGVFLYRRKIAIIVIAFFVAAIIVGITCLKGNAIEGSFTLNVRSDEVLNLYLSSENNIKMDVVKDASEYPFDNSVAAYVESIKPMKSAGGRSNPYFATKIFYTESLEKMLCEPEYKQYLKDNGISGSISVNGKESPVRIALTFTDKALQSTVSEKLRQLTIDYLDKRCDDYINSVLETHKALLDQDKKILETLSQEYKTAVAKTGADPLSNEECRALLNKYAQTAYNRDVSQTVIDTSEQLLKLETTPQVGYEGSNVSANGSPVRIVVFGAFGLVVGAVFGCFAVYILSFLGDIAKKAKDEKNKK